jgi:hypothetical protein
VGVVAQIGKRRYMSQWSKQVSGRSTPRRATAPIGRDWIGPTIDLGGLWQIENTLPQQGSNPGHCRLASNLILQEKQHFSERHTILSLVTVREIEYLRVFRRIKGHLPFLHGSITSE